MGNVDSAQIHLPAPRLGESWDHAVYQTRRKMGCPEDQDVESEKI